MGVNCSERPIHPKILKSIFLKWAQTRASVHEHADTGANLSERPVHRKISRNMSEVGANSSERSPEHADMGANSSERHFSLFLFRGSSLGPLGRLGGSLVTLGGHVGLTLLELGSTWPPFGYTLATFLMNLGTLGAQRIISRCFLQMWDDR